MTFQLPKLNYEYAALEPYIDAKTMEIHLTKHHQAYISKANETLAGTAFENKTAEDILRSFNDVPENIKTIVQNHVGGHANHSLFWEILSPIKSAPSTELANAIDSDLGGMASFKEKLTALAMGRFGSGWAWVNVKNGKLELENSANQDSPLMSGKTPILGLDVWEHAYYLNYQNRRADYIEAFFNIINWTKVSELYTQAK
jgi:Fe-Mn family superoxide dismutase